MAVSGNVKKSNNPNREIGSFFRGLKAEIKRITWASKKDTKKATVAVFSFCIFFIILVGFVDLGFKELFAIIFK